MKKGTVLNADISAVISRLGHTDTLVVCDAGLPVPRSSTRIDMALTQGVPSFMQVLEVVTTEMQVEAAVIAEEIKTHNPQLHATLLTHLEQLQQHQGNTIEIRYTSHEQFKKQTADSQAVIRSGECSPFANIILCAGVTFTYRKLKNQSIPLSTPYAT
ncbi:D-ribose pyranase [Klebsiella pneumoniae]|nr:D-ribose pyranase [Klebsiella pneumoniae]